MATVETVAGPVQAEDLGFTLSHEHIAMQPAFIAHHYPWMVDRDKIRRRAIDELTEAKAGGVDTIIELSTPDLERDVELIQEVAATANIQVVVATGLWRDIPRYFWTRSPEQIADIFVREIEVGIGRTEIKAGAIKVANDAEGVTPEAELVLRGAAQACIRTGTPISTHHWAPLEVGRRQVEIFQDEGVPMDRVCIGHSADSTDADYLQDLLQAGVYLSMDRYPGSGDRPNWEQRNATVSELVQRGWAAKIMLGHDYAPGLQPQESPTRYLFLITTALPALRAQGMSEDTIHEMTHDVPRRFLSGES